ncbi:hypothetical protein CAC42_6813 [Sphaceloma murrayae]|uniref:Uncharacterized protein n=1 Tax=Sphaceloma murrayae TaxID=2082308 RepID=A0A2K1QHC1_9PEZI|nr:hypothetical protein CAC42_6813 [Sphaceloma murrayae]
MQSTILLIQTPVSAALPISKATPPFSKSAHKMHTKALFLAVMALAAFAAADRPSDSADHGHGGDGSPSGGMIYSGPNVRNGGGGGGGSNTGSRRVARPYQG